MFGVEEKMSGVIFGRIQLHLHCNRESFSLLFLTNYVRELENLRGPPSHTQLIYLAVYPRLHWFSTACCRNSEFLRRTATGNKENVSKTRGMTCSWNATQVSQMSVGVCVGVFVCCVVLGRIRNICRAESGAVVVFGFFSVLLQRTRSTFSYHGYSTIQLFNC